MSDLNSHRIAAALERIADALEKANEGIVLSTVEETVAPGVWQTPSGVHTFTETNLDGNVVTTRVNAEGFILCSNSDCPNVATIAPKSIFNPFTGSWHGYPGSYGDRNDGLCDECRRLRQEAEGA